jgi:hypothetical protein
VARVHGRTARGAAASASRAAGHEADRREGEGDRAHVEPPGPGQPDPDREGPLPDRRVTLHVAQVVRLEQRHREQADRDRGGHRRRAQPAVLDEGRAGRGHQAEVDEDEDLPQPEVAVGVGAAGVEPTGGDAAEADGHQPPPDRRGQRQAGGAGQRERDDRRRPHLARGGEARGGEPHRAHPLVVGAPDPVGVVVGVVGAHLDEDRHRQRAGGPPPQDPAGGGDPADGGAHRDRDGRRGQGAGPGPGHPAPHPASRWRAGPGRHLGHGRRGKREKSGRRRST